MSGRDWKPGDVAATEYKGVKSRTFVVEGRCCPREHPRTPHWHGASGGWNPLDDTCVSYRPLVVLDPEDREQIERLCVSLERMSFSPWACGATTCLTTALREFANPKPPKPAEPTGLGAVVEDSQGERWVRVAELSKSWRSEHASALVDYALIDAVSVLSDGVQP